jgi:hypothetical protein
MRVYKAQEILAELEVRGGTPEEQAAALAVVQSAILESRRLGRIAIKKPRTSWANSASNLRGPLEQSWHSKARS